MYGRGGSGGDGSESAGFEGGEGVNNEMVSLWRELPAFECWGNTRMRACLWACRHRLCPAHIPLP
jgi:hypothetical protein